MCQKCREAYLKKQKEEEEQKKREKEQIRLANIEKQAQQQRELERVENERRERYTRTRGIIETMPLYQAWRNNVFIKYGRVCMKCGGSGYLEVDHVMSFYSVVKSCGLLSALDELDEQTIKDVAYECHALWDVENGRPLCKQCHDRTSTSARHRIHNEVS